MKSSTKTLWRLLGASGLACLLLMLLGFAWALNDTWNPSAGLALPEGPPPPTASGGSWSEKPEVLVAALGDSLTRGTGDATGSGYVRGAVDRLAEALDKPVRLVNNLAVNGMTAEDLLPLLDDAGYRHALGQADLILLSVGGNDLFRLATGNGEIARSGDLSPEQLKERLPEAQEGLRRVLAKLREINPAARIVYIGLYNPFYDVEELRPASALIQQWNARAHELAEDDGRTTIVPTYDLFEANIGLALASDHFHPNAGSYAKIAERVAQALL